MFHARKGDDDTHLTFPPHVHVCVSVYTCVNLYMCQGPGIVVDRTGRCVGTLQVAGMGQEDGMAGWESVDIGAGKPFLSKVKECCWQWVVWLQNLGRTELYPVDNFVSLSAS